MNNNEDICSICYEELNSMQNNNIENNQLNQNNAYTLECNHKYHSSCIIKWFRSGRNNCPLCNDTTLDTNLGYFQKIETIKETKKISKKKCCPDNIKKTVEKIKKCEIENKNATKAFNDFKKSNKLIYTMERKLRKDKFKSSRQIRMLEHKLLALIKINPIYIKN